MPDDNFFAHRRAASPAAADRDRRLALAVVRALATDVRTTREAVRVAAQNEVVLLNGVVGSWQVRRAAGELARRTSGAVDVCNALRVSADAWDERPADAFAELVASLPDRRRRIPFQDHYCVRAIGRSRALARWVLAALLVMWAGLAIGMTAGGPELPLSLAGSAVTAVVAVIWLVRRLGRRGRRAG